jgi:hypothetical protein
MRSSTRRLASRPGTSHIPTGSGGCATSGSGNPARAQAGSTGPACRGQSCSAANARCAGSGPSKSDRTGAIPPRTWHRDSGSPTSGSPTAARCGCGFTSKPAHRDNNARHETCGARTGDPGLFRYPGVVSVGRFHPDAAITARSGLDTRFRSRPALPGSSRYRSPLAQRRMNQGRDLSQLKSPARFPAGQSPTGRTQQPGSQFGVVARHP